jgi:PmbA protein
MVKTMLRKDFSGKVMKYGKSKGFTDMEIYYSSGSNLSIKVFEQKIDNYSLSQSEGVSFRGLYNNKMGYSYTEKIDDTSVKFLVDEALGNAEIIDTDDEEQIFGGSSEYVKIDNYNPSLEDVKEEDKIALTLKMEEEAKKLDPRIESIQYCVYGDGSDEMNLENSKGLNLEDRSNAAFAYIGVVAKENEDIKTGFGYKVTNDFSELNPGEIAKEAVEEAISMLGAETVESGNYKVILRNNAAADLIDAFSGIFSAERVQKDLSLLKGKLNEKIAIEKLTLVDNPHLKDGFASSSFDGEGHATFRKNIIENGVLKTYMHNLKTAEKDGVESTGNASRGSYKASIGISPSNLHVKKGNVSLDKMIEEMDSGILIIDLQGLHSGLNSLSGDFSLSCYGYMVEDGKRTRPVNQITVSGNFFDMINNIEEIGSDLRFGLPSDAYIGSPSIKIDSLSIAGK